MPIDTADQAVGADATTALPEGGVPDPGQGAANQPSTGLDTSGSPQGSEFIELRDGTKVTLDELEKGYQRQADYTRKTQALAQERQQNAQAVELLHALASDPEGTLRTLQENLLGDVDTDLDIDPLEQAVRQQGAQLESFQAREFERELDGIMSGLEQRYADFDREAVVQWAIDQEIPNLEAAYLHRQAQMSADADRQARNAEALRAKQGLPPHTTGSRALGVDTQEFEPAKSVADALQNALREMGLTEAPTSWA